MGDHRIRGLTERDIDIIIGALAVDSHGKIVELAELAHGAAGVGIANLAEGIVVRRDVNALFDHDRTEAEREHNVVFVQICLSLGLRFELPLIGEEHIAAVGKETGLPGSETAAHQLSVVGVQAVAAVRNIVEITADGKHGVCLRGKLRRVIIGLSAEGVVGDLAAQLACVGDEDLGKGADRTVLALLPDYGEERFIEIVADDAAVYKLLVGVPVKLLPVNELFCFVCL